MELSIKAIALLLFFLFMILQIWFGTKAKIIAYFFFILAAVQYIMKFNISLWLQFVLIIAIMVIIIVSLYFEIKGKEQTDDSTKNV